LSLTPRRGAHESATARQRATAVTAARADGVGLDANVTVVDLSGRPGVGACGVSEDRHGALLKGVGNAAGAAGSAPAGDSTRRSGVVPGVRGSHRDVAGVAIGGDVGETQNGNVVRVALVSVVHKAAVPGEAGERAKGASAAVGHGAVAGSSQDRVASYRSASAVSRTDSLDPTDKRGSTRVRVADTHRQLPRVVGDVGIAASHNSRVEVLAERRQRQTQ